MTDTATMVALGEDYPELRESVRKICERYPGAYWRKLETEQDYPTEFITELTQGGFLASLIPEEYGGVGLGRLAVCVLAEELGRAVAPVLDTLAGERAGARGRRDLDRRRGHLRLGLCGSHPRVGPAQAGDGAGRRPRSRAHSAAVQRRPRRPGR